MSRRPLMVRAAEHGRDLQVFRAPGRFGIFIREGNQDAEVWEWPGLPANDNVPKLEPSIIYEDY